MSKPVELIDYLFAGQPHLLAAGLLAWMQASPRFTAFVETYRDKIRKKLRATLERESLLDLQAELETARCLLDDGRIQLTYEPYASEKRRGPDFAVTYRSGQPFNLEVARLRPETGGPGGGLQRTEERIVRILLNKLGQMQAGMPNLLAIHVPDEVACSVDLAALLQALKTRAESRDPTFYAASRYSGPAAFYRQFLQLNGVLLWAPHPQLWANRQARRRLEERVLRLLVRLPASGQP